MHEHCGHLHQLPVGPGPAAGLLGDAALHRGPAAAGDGEPETGEAPPCGRCLIQLVKAVSSTSFFILFHFIHFSHHPNTFVNRTHIENGERGLWVWPWPGVFQPLIDFSWQQPAVSLVANENNQGHRIDRLLSRQMCISVALRTHERAHAAMFTQRTAR